MNDTIALLRKMRDAATMRQLSAFHRFRNGIHRLLGRQEPLHPQREALVQAEELANAAGDFFATKLSRAGRKERRSAFDKWQSLLYDPMKQYNIHNITTFARTSIGKVVGYSIIGRLRNIYIDPEHMIHWDLVENNNLGADSVDQIVEQSMGVISPLSGDYLMARVYSAFLKRTRGKWFPTRAAAFSRDLSEKLLPVDEDGEPAFANKKFIGLYIDTTATGRTAQALFAAVKNTCPPDVVVHQPKGTRTDFEESTKMKEYWARYRE